MMAFLCDLFGHKRNSGWFGDGLHGKVVKGPIDGIGREHFRVVLNCDRCGKDYTAARFHGHSVKLTPTPAESERQQGDE